MARFLYKGSIHFGTNVFTINCTPLNDPTKGKRSLTFRGEDDRFKTFLRRIKAKDSSTFPPSSKQRTYQQMIDDAKNGDDSKPIYIWSNMIPKGDTIHTLESFLDSDLDAKHFIEDKLENG